ncbi:MAG: acyltransferase, partial [Odoribacter sp.]|nr:acyltransferase [Odoribacter sp.]
KPHYQLLDGLRGVAALMVMWYHIFEGFATSPIDQNFNHGYLAVDFFFMLSGFVVSYAYDDRWKSSLTLKGFLKRRLIRLQPMVVMGVFLGAITFIIQGQKQWDGTPVTLSMLFLALLLNLFLIPAIPGSRPEVRGNGEMYPLNGPNWSLFFEYIGNILYALFIRKMSTRWLATLTCISGLGLTLFALCNLYGFGHLGVGWSLSDYNFPGGMLRLLFSFCAGLLISRIFKPIAVRGAFWICSLLIILLLSIPYIGNENTLWTNGLYDSVCILIIFPLLLWIGASGKATDNKTARVCKFLGDISYPVYVVHYPFMYLFYAWLWSGEKIPFAEAWPIALLVYFGSILLAYICLKWYDEPLREWLNKRL